MDPQSHVVYKIASGSCFISAQGFSLSSLFTSADTYLSLHLGCLDLKKCLSHQKWCRTSLALWELVQIYSVCESRVMNHFRFPCRTSRAAAIAVIVMISREI